MKKEVKFQQKQLIVDFNDVDMNSKSQMWTDDMSKSVFNYQSGLPQNGTSGGKKTHVKTTIINTSRASRGSSLNRFR